MLRARSAPSKVITPCHSEERSDEESAFAAKKRNRFLSRACGIGMTGQEDFHLYSWGPKAHVTLGKTSSDAFSEPARHSLPLQAYLTLPAARSAGGNAYFTSILC